MIEKLVTDFFNKLEEKELLTNKNAKAKFFVEKLLEEKHNKINYIAMRTATRLYDKYVEKKNESVKEPDAFLRNVMSEYLGHENFEEFVIANTSEVVFKQKNSVRNKKSFNKKNVLTAFVTGSLTFGSIAFLNTSSNDCVIWQNDKFIEVNCEEYQNAIHKSKISVDIEHFRQIYPTQDFTFFNGKNAIIFYGKNENGKIEYFNRLTFHPETKKPLKPVTRYILNKEGLLDE